jgi:ABC-2 type transport system ATP-binding protein
MVGEACSGLLQQHAGDAGGHGHQRFSLGRVVTTGTYLSCLDFVAATTLGLVIRARICSRVRPERLFDRVCSRTVETCPDFLLERGRIACMAKRATILKVTGLRRAFGPNTIFDKFNLEVRTGEAIALTGRNGAGKSTLLRCLVGADRPDDGNVQVCGNPMLETSPEIRRDVATVIDDLDFFPDLSVVEHLDLLARAHGIADPDELVDEVLEEVQLVPQSGQLPGTLSSGQRRRLALATAFVRPRKLLILDEPEQRLDTEGLSWLSQRLKSERQKGLAIVFASHEPELVDSVATRVIQLGAPRG